MPQSKPIGLILLWGLYLALFYFLYKVIGPFIYPILWAGIFTVIFYPLHRRILVFTKHRETVAAAVTMTILVFAVIIPGAFLITLIVSESIDFAQAVLREGQFGLDRYLGNPYVQDLANRVTDLLNVQHVDVTAVFKEKLRYTAGVTITRAEQILFNIPSAFFDFFITLFTTFFLLRDGRYFADLLRTLIPLSESEINYYFENLRKVINVTFIGVLLTAFVQGLIAFIAFFFIGLSSSLLLGVATALASLVPVVGSALVWVPVSLYLLATGAILKGVLVILVGVFFISLVDNFVRPLFLHQYLSLHLLMTFFSLFGGIKAFGLIGIFLGPVIVSAFIGCCLFYQDYRRNLIKDQGVGNEGSKVL